jgi:formyl-CoA transferase
VRDPQYLSREMIVRQMTNDGEDLALPGIVPKLSATPGSLRMRAPALGEHTESVLRDLGVTSEQVAGWRERGIVE